MGVLMSPVAKTLVVQTSQGSMRGTGLGFSVFIETILDDADADAVLATLGGGTSGIAVFKDTTAAAIRTEIGASVGYAFEAKSASFTAADAKSYDVDSSGGAVVPTCPAAGAGLKFRVKLKTAGNNCTVTRAGADTVDGATTYVMSVAGENYSFEVDNTGTNWAVFG